MAEEMKSSNAGAPPIALGYESPIFVEKRPRKEYVSRPPIYLALLIGLGGIAILVLTWHGRFFLLMQTMAWVDIAIAILMALRLEGARATTSVFPDRVQFALTGAGFRFWGCGIRWSDIEQCDVFAHGHVIGGSAAKGEPAQVNPKRGTTFSVGLQGTFLMFRGDGVRFLLKDGQRIYAGSDDANRLANVVDETIAAWKEAAATRIR